MEVKAGDKCRWMIENGKWREAEKKYQNGGRRILPGSALNTYTFDLFSDSYVHFFHFPSIISILFKPTSFPSLSFVSPFFAPSPFYLGELFLLSTYLPTLLPLSSLLLSLSSSSSLFFFLSPLLWVFFSLPFSQLFLLPSTISKTYTRCRGLQVLPRSFPFLLDSNLYSFLPLFSVLSLFDSLNHKILLGVCFLKKKILIFHSDTWLSFK